MLGFNWIDLAIFLSLVFFAVDAIGRPLILEILDLISFLLALIISFRYYQSPAGFFERQYSLPHGLSLVVGFMVAWFLTEIIFYFFIRAVISKIRWYRIFGPSFLSIVPAILRGLIFISLILVVIATFPIQPKLKQAVNQSILGNFLLKYAYQMEQPIKQVFGGVSNDTLNFLTVEPKTNESINLGFQTTNYKIDETEEFAMINLVNQERTSRGIPALTLDARLRSIARDHSEDMFRRGYFSHYSPEGKSVADRAQAAGIDYLVIGENLAYAPTLEMAHQGLMNSPGHRANILSTDYHKIGIGVADGGDYGRMFTQEFEN